MRQGHGKERCKSRGFLSGALAADGDLGTERVGSTPGGVVSPQAINCRLIAQDATCLPQSLLLVSDVEPAQHGGITRIGSNVLHQRVDLELDQTGIFQ